MKNLSLKRSPEIATLESENLLLTPLRKQDASALFAFASQEEVARTVSWKRHASVAESTAYIGKVTSQFSVEQGSLFMVWGVRERGTSQIIGTVSLTQLGAIRAQIGFVFKFEHWARSIPLDALRLAMEHAFHEFPYLERVQARCLPTNTVSKSLLENLGMQFEGVNHAMIRRGNEAMDLACYAMVRKVWRLVSQHPPLMESGEGHC